MFNLKSWRNHEAILYRTLQTLEKLVMNSHMCRQSPDSFSYLREIAKNCVSLPFLEEPKMIKMRTSYFAVLSASLFLLHQINVRNVFNEIIIPINNSISEILNGKGKCKGNQIK
eukprot:UN26925